MAASFSETLESIKSRLEKAKLDGELANKDEQTLNQLYNQIVVDELRKLKDKIKADKSGEAAKSILDETKLSINTDTEVCHNNFMNACSICINNLGDIDDDDDISEDELYDELDKIDHEEAEMGWSLSEDTKARLRERSHFVALDLLSNEVRDLAIAVVSGFMIGGAGGAATATVICEIRFKLIQFFINCIIDIISFALGRNVNVLPPPPIQLPQTEVLASTQTINQ